MTYKKFPHPSSITDNVSKHIKTFAYKLPDGYSTAGGIPICNLVLTLLLSVNYLAGYDK